HFALHTGLTKGQVIVGDLAFIEAVIGDLLAVRRPPHGGALEQLLAVDPAGGTVLDAGLLAAVGGDGEFVAALGVTDPQVAVPIERLVLAVRRKDRGGLPAASGGPGRIAPFGSSP